MTDKQSEALRLADEVTMAYSLYHACLENPERHMTVLLDAAAELRRLNALNAELVEALRRCAASLNPNHEHTAFVFAALAKAEGK